MKMENFGKATYYIKMGLVTIIGNVFNIRQSCIFVLLMGFQWRF